MDIEALNKFIDSETPAETAGLQEQLIVVYGDKKVGKSTFAANAPSPLFLDCEHGMRTVDGPDGKPPRQVKINTWSGKDKKHSLMGWLKILESTTPEEMGVQTIVIDGINEAYRYLVQEVLTEHNAQHLNDGALGYGKGRDLCNDRLHRWFIRLRQLPFGIIICAHDATMEFENNSVKYDKKVPFIEPSKPAHGWNAIKPAVSMILHAVKEGRKDQVEHVMYTKGSEIREAADPKGCLPMRMPFKYEALVEAYNTDQTTDQ